MYTPMRWGIYLSNLAFWFQGKAKKIVPAQTLWFDILKAQIETGVPYMLYKVHSMTCK
jgi:ribonucleoside-diphosphate reductase subunit M1